MLTINDLKPGTVFVYKGQPCEVLETQHVKKARGGAVLQTKIKNLMTGNVLSQNFKQADKFEEAQISRIPSKFVYVHQNQYWFSKKNQPSERFFLNKEQIGEKSLFLKPNMEAEALFFQGKIFGIELPIKVDLKVVEAPPGVKGDRSQGGTKTVVLETGAKVQTPLFIEEGDIIRVNTQSGEYSERVKRR